MRAYMYTSGRVYNSLHAPFSFFSFSLPYRERVRMRATFTVVLLAVILRHARGVFDVHDLDWSTRPADDFFMFVNSRWINRTSVPSSETEWGGIFTMKHENTYKLKRILDDLVRYERNHRPYPADSIERKLTDFYVAGLDERAIERAGLEPLKATLVELQSIETYQELIRFALTWYTKMNHGLIFDFDVHADEHNSSVYMVHWKQTGIQLPERDYYFRNDPASKTIRSKYILYINRLLTLSNALLGTKTSYVDAEDILALEAQLAVSHRTPSELRDAELNTHHYNVSQLHRMMPNLDWPGVLSLLTIENQTMVMAQPDYYLLLDKLIARQPLHVWKNKIRFTILHDLSRYLNRDFVRAHFRMFDQHIYGQRSDKTRWTKIIEEIDRYLGDLLGQLYVARHFSSESKARTMTLVENLIDVYRERIQDISWLSPTTKAKALKKLHTISVKIGYPSTWKSFDDVTIDRSSLFNSMASIWQHDYRKQMRDLKRPVDRDEWIIPPQIVNAFYYPPFNEILFPAGVLQEPFFSLSADDALNYGAIGYIIGHELTHSLDDQGRKYDEHGNLHHWWTPSDIDEFQLRTEKLVKQFDAYEVLNTTINGQLTLGENIADLGGLEIAYQAFQRTEQARENRLVGGLTPAERFFFAFAKTWRVKLTDEKTLFHLKQDPHAPVNLRINGPLTNMADFYRTFNVTRGDAMFREAHDRVVIW